MSAGRPEAETILELCLVSFAAAMVAALVVLGHGRRSATASRRRRSVAGPPAPGVVAGERHRHVRSVAAR